MKRRTISYTKLVLLCFIGVIKYEEYRKALDFLLKMALTQEVSRMEHITFQNPKQIFFDHKIEEPTFMALEDVIINIWGYKQEKFLKYIKWNAKVFYYVDKQADNTYYHIIGSTKAIEDFLTVYNFKSWSIKRNLTKKERSFVYKFINGYFKNKYSWSYVYWEILLDDIQELKTDIMELEVIEELIGLTEEEEEEKEEMKIQLEYKTKLEDKLLYSVSDEPTTIDDYYKENVNVNPE